MQEKTVARIVVSVNNRPWTRLSTLQKAGPNDAVYVLDPKEGRVRFGDGTHGRMPQVGATIGITYRYGAGSTGNISKRINKVDDIARFWVVVRRRQQTIGWGKRSC